MVKTGLIALFFSFLVIHFNSYSIDYIECELSVSTDSLLVDSTSLQDDEILLDTSADEKIESLPNNKDGRDVESSEDSSVENMSSSGAFKKINFDPNKKIDFKKNTPVIKKLTVTQTAFISVPAIGFGQIYNKDYWKLPIVYGGIGGSIALSVLSFQEWKRERVSFTTRLAAGVPESSMLTEKSRMQQLRNGQYLFMASAITFYMYSLADAVWSFDGSFKNLHIHKPTLLAVFFPGMGQIYNKRYWKVPFVYAGFAVLGYLVNMNQKGYQRYNAAFKAAVDGDPTTVDEFNGTYSEEVLRKTKNSYRRDRDFACILMGVWYLLSIVDAHVDAYLMDYDVSDDLTMRVDPVFRRDNMVFRETNSIFAPGLKLTLTF